MAKLIHKELIEKDLKLLEKSLQLAQESKSSRLLAEIALAWSYVDAEKAQEILGQIDSKEARVKALRQMARQNGWNSAGSHRITP